MIGDENDLGLDDDNIFFGNEDDFNESGDDLNDDMFDDQMED